MRSWIVCITSCMFCLAGCSSHPVSVTPTTLIPAQFGSFTFDVTDEWRMTGSEDTLFLEKDSCRIKVYHGYNLTFSLFRTLPPTRLPELTIPEMRRLNHYFPSPFYPDSLPDSLATLRFKVSIDSLLRIYTCNSDSTNFPSEFLAVHPLSGNSIHFETISGHTDADSLFDLVAANLRFVPEFDLPVLLAFSLNDTTINCCSQLLSDETANPYYAKTVMRVSDTIIEYWTSARFDNTTVKTLDHSVQVKGDSILLSAVPGLWDLEYIEQSGFIASPPRMVHLQCDCWTCNTVYFKIQVPAGSINYKLKFTEPTVSLGETIILE